MKDLKTSNFEQFNNRITVTACLCTQNSASVYLCVYGSKYVVALGHCPKATQENCNQRTSALAWKYDSFPMLAFLLLLILYLCRLNNTGGGRFSPHSVLFGILALNRMNQHYIFEVPGLWVGVEERSVRVHYVISQHKTPVGSWLSFQKNKTNEGTEDVKVTVPKFLPYCVNMITYEYF